MPTKGTGSWHQPGCRDVGVVASNWERRGDIWYLKGTDKAYTPMKGRTQEGTTWLRNHATSTSG